MILLTPAFAENVCQYATSATATSSNTGSEPFYATGAPDANDNCSIWSGTARSWNAVNANTKANITLNYPEPIYIDNITIFADYYPCYSYVWILDEENWIPVYIGELADCTVELQNITPRYITQSIRIETCGYSWSSIDAVRMCGEPAADHEPQITIKTPIQNETIPGYRTSVDVQIETDTTSECRYSFADFSYEDGILFTLTDDRTHSFILSGLEPETDYKLYYRCKSTYSAVNTGSAIHEFHTG
ncbi:MAG: hypothetical protein U9P44_01585, partial [archaeon]|nr:hypothetical protein [archaeon]